MKVQGLQLAWIVVKDLKSALDFYTRVVGLTVKSHSPEFGWAELAGPEGALLGIAQESPCMEEKAGINAVLTIAVDDLDSARSHFLSQNATLIGSIVEVPGHVRMQTFTDVDGNRMQIVQTLSAKTLCCEQEMCCK